MVFSMAGALPHLASSGQWVTLGRTFKVLLWLIQHVPGTTPMLLAARGASRIEGVLMLTCCTNCVSQP
jgi:hypothetical protein